jgi:bifunctional non-homologous end joining protein LigD
LPAISTLAQCRFEARCDAARRPCARSAQTDTVATGKSFDQRILISRTDRAKGVRLLRGFGKVRQAWMWVHEIKHDGYRLMVRRDGLRVRCFTRNGHDWSHRFPLISAAALRNRCSSFVLDGEAVLLGVDGRSDFNGLHSREHDDEVQFYAFDCLVSDGEDVRKLPLSLRKTNLSRLLARRVDGIFLSDFEQGEIGPDLFPHDASSIAP